MVNQSKPTVVRSLNSTWSQLDMGSEFDIDQVTLLQDLDPSGSAGVIGSVLTMFLKSIDPALTLIDQHRAAGALSGLKFEAHKLQSASGQVGALRLEAACKAVSVWFTTYDAALQGPVDEPLGLLLDQLRLEAVRAERRLRQMGME